MTKTWLRTPNGHYQTRTTDPRTGKVYLSAPVPLAFAVKLGMTPLEQQHADATRNPPPYEVRKELREATLAIGRETA